MGNLSERDKIVLGKLRANYYLKPDEGRFYRKRDDRPVKGYLRDKKDRYMHIVIITMPYGYTITVTCPRY